MADEIKAVEAGSVPSAAAAEKGTAHMPPSRADFLRERGYWIGHRYTGEFVENVYKLASSDPVLLTAEQWNAYGDASKSWDRQSKAILLLAESRVSSPETTEDKAAALKLGGYWLGRKPGKNVVENLYTLHTQSKITAEEWNKKGVCQLTWDKQSKAITSKLEKPAEAEKALGPTVKKIVPSGIYNGAFLGDDESTSANLAEAVKSYEKATQSKLHYVVLFQRLGSSSLSSECKILLDRGITPFVKIEPWEGLDRINSGANDSQIRRLAEDAKRLGKPLFISFAHEMNMGKGEQWYPWQGEPEKYVKAYQRFVDIFNEAGADNVTWVWNINVDGGYVDYYPGDEYVDWVAVDGYSGPTAKNVTTPEEVLGNTIDSVKRAYPDKPVMIGETACDRGLTGNLRSFVHSTRSWNYAKELPSFAREKGLGGFVYFNEDKDEGGKYVRWALGRSAKALSQGLKENESHISKGIAVAEVPIEEPKPEPVPAEPVPDEEVPEKDQQVADDGTVDGISKQAEGLASSKMTEQELRDALTNDPVLRQAVRELAETGSVPNSEELLKIINEVENVPADGEKKMEEEAKAAEAAKAAEKAAEEAKAAEAAKAAEKAAEEAKTAEAAKAAEKAAEEAKTAEAAKAAAKAAEEAKAAEAAKAAEKAAEEAKTAEAAKAAKAAEEAKAATPVAPAPSEMAIDRPLKIIPNGIYHGAYLVNDAPSAKMVEEYEKATGEKLDYVVLFHAFVKSFKFPSDICNMLAERNIAPFIKLEPFSWGGADDQSFSLRKIIAGNFDEDIVQFAKGTADFGKPIFITFAHEMNTRGSYPWGLDKVTQDEYIDAYRHVVELFRGQGAHNVTWVYNINIDDTGFLGSFPGQEYVDWIAIDGYTGWHSIHTDASIIFSNTLGHISRDNRFYGIPIMIGETACDDPNPKVHREVSEDDKGKYLESLPKFCYENDVSGFVYFDVPKKYEGFVKREVSWALGKYAPSLEEGISKYRDEFATSITTQSGQKGR